MEFTSLDLRYAALELQQLAGAKVEQIFQSDIEKRDILFRLYAQNQKFYLRFMPGIVAYAREKAAYPQQPPGFAMFLRKYLQGARLQSVQQRGFDRVLVMTFAGRLGTFDLVIELIPPGNMLLLQEGRIINLLESQQFKDRQLRGRQEYVPPPQSFDITAATHEQLAERITVSTRDSIVTTLAMHIGLGGIYAEEVLARAGIAKHRNDLAKEEVMAVAAAAKELMEQPIQAHSDEHRAYPFRMRSRQAKPLAEGSFLAAVSAFIHDAPAERKELKKATAKSKLQTMIDAQRQQVAKFQSEAALEQRKGERIFEEYQLIQEILQCVHEARARKQDIRAALERFPQVREYKEQTGELELELEG